MLHVDLPCECTPLYLNGLFFVDFINKFVCYCYGVFENMELISSLKTEKFSADKTDFYGFNFIKNTSFFVIFKNIAPHSIFYRFLKLFRHN